MSNLDFDSLNDRVEPIESMNAKSILKHDKNYLEQNCQLVTKNRKELIDSVIKSFNTWYFKREQPDSVQKLYSAIDKALELRQPIPFVLYWGKGPRAEQAHPDLKCLNYLNELVSRIKLVYQLGANITLILTDTHANLNGFSLTETQGYYSEIALSASRLGFNHCYLSELVDKIDNEQKTQSSPSDTMLSALTLSASKWYRGNNVPRVVARTYYAMNMVEKRAVESEFSDAIFITFNGSAMRELFPETMSIFYMYSIKRGTSVKPWFLPASYDAGAGADNPGEI